MSPKRVNGFWFWWKFYHRCVLGQGSPHYILEVIRIRSLYPDTDSGSRPYSTSLADVCGLWLLLLRKYSRHRLCLYFWSLERVFSSSGLIMRPRRAWITTNYLSDRPAVTDLQQFLTVCYSTVGHWPNFRCHIKVENQKKRYMHLKQNNASRERLAWHSPSNFGRAAPICKPCMVGVR